MFKIKENNSSSRGILQSTSLFKDWFCCADEKEWKWKILSRLKGKKIIALWVIIYLNSTLLLDTVRWWMKKEEKKTNWKVILIAQSIFGFQVEQKKLKYWFCSTRSAIDGSKTHVLMGKKRLQLVFDIRVVITISR